MGLHSCRNAPPSFHCLISWAALLPCLLLLVIPAISPQVVHVVDGHQENSDRLEDDEEGHHHCIHDTPAIQRLYHNGMDIEVPMPKEDDVMTAVRVKVNSAGVPEAHDASSKREFQLQAQGPIRWVLRTGDLTNTAKYCTSVGDVAPDFQGQNVQCMTQDDIFTAAKRSILLDKILPAAIAKVSQMMSITQRTSNIIVPGTCGEVTIPDADKTTGVANADYVLYLSAGATVQGTLAWAGFCFIETASNMGGTNRGRAIVGRANFGPANIQWDDSGSPAGEKLNDKMVRTAVHELFHALGFAKEYIRDRFMTNFATTETTTARGGAPTIYMLTPQVVATARSYFGCPTIKGPELEVGEASDFGSHWNRRAFYEDVMSPVVGASKISAFTLAFFADTGFYTINSSFAEEVTWGKGAGCGFLTEKCNTVAGGSGSYFCFDTTGFNKCTYNHMAIGKCKTGTYQVDLPSYWQYFSSPRVGGTVQYMDNCPIVEAYTNKECTGSYGSPGTTDEAFGFYYGPSGRCVEAPRLIKNGYSDPNPSGQNDMRCMKARCPDGNKIELQIGGGTEAGTGLNINQTDWFSCPTNGAAGDISPPSGWSGTIKCPEASSFCTPDLFYAVVPTTPTPPTPAPITTPVPTTTPAPPTPTPGACPPGYLGFPDCNIVCPGRSGTSTAGCSGHGSCELLPGGTAATCNCDIGWGASNTNDCSSCGDIYTGSDCTVRCPRCRNGAFCLLTPTEAFCDCQTTYRGTTCETLCPGTSDPNDVKTVCSGHGTCGMTTATCTCTDGYSGADCASKQGSPTTPPATPTPTAPPSFKFKGTLAGNTSGQSEREIAVSIATKLSMNSSDVIIIQYDPSDQSIEFELKGAQAKTAAETIEKNPTAAGLASAVLVVSPSPSDDSGLSAGAAVGIVFAFLLVVGLLVGCIVFGMMRKKQAKDNRSGAAQILDNLHDARKEAMVKHGEEGNDVPMLAAEYGQTSKGGGGNSPTKTTTTKSPVLKKAPAKMPTLKLKQSPPGKKASPNLSPRGAPPPTGGLSPRGAPPPTGGLNSPRRAPVTTVQPQPTRSVPYVVTAPSPAFAAAATVSPQTVTSGGSADDDLEVEDVDPADIGGEGNNSDLDIDSDDV